MAFGARRVYPNDLRRRVDNGVNLLCRAPGVLQSNYQTKDAIKNNLNNYFLTKPGERIENSCFEACLRKYIFTQIKTGNLDFIKEDIQTKLNDNFPNIQVEEVEVLRSVNENTIQINITYSIPNTGINDTLELNFR